MKYPLFILIALTLLSCSSKAGNPENDSTDVARKVNIYDASSLSSESTDRKPVPDPIIGERIDGPANIRDTTTGALLFTLEDNTLVTCSMLRGDWYTVGLMMNIDTSEVGLEKIKKGRKIIVDGEMAGEIKADMKVQTMTNNKTAWVEIIGHTHKDNIQPQSIIENAISDFLKSNDDSRAIQDWQDFIGQFELEKTDQFEDYSVYYNYENWLVDPSPMWRIGLVFQKEQLLAILHARPLVINGMVNHQLERGFDCLTFDESDESEKVIKVFNNFVTSVD